MNTWKNFDEESREEFKETFSGSKDIFKDSVKLVVVNERSEKAKEEVLEDLEAHRVNLSAIEI